MRTVVAGCDPELWVVGRARPETFSQFRRAGHASEINGASVECHKTALEKYKAVLAVLALVATVLLASVAAAQAPHTRRTYTVIGLRDCTLVVDGARALGLVVTRTDGAGTCTVTVTGPLPKMRAIDATVGDLTDSGGCAASE
jgi:hypothetical protein